MDEVGFVKAEGNGKPGSGASLVSDLTGRFPHWLYECFELAYNAYGLLLLSASILKKKPDLIYERYALFTFAGILASKIFKLPIIVEVNSPLSLEKKNYGELFFQGLAKRCERWICSSSFRTIAVTAELKKILSNRIGVPPEKIVVMQNGIDSGLFRQDIEGGRIRSEYGLESKTVLGFVGWFRKWHGLERLVRAYADRRMHEKGAVLMLVGDGPAMEDLRAACGEKNLTDKEVIFTGPVPREGIPEYIAAFDLCLQPDVTPYASPIKLFEYMAMGKAIVAPARGNIIEILGKNYPGLFKADDFDDMARKISSLIETKDKTKELSALVGSIMKSKRYSWDENAKNTLRLVAPRETKIRDRR